MKTEVILMMLLDLFMDYTTNLKTVDIVILLLTLLVNVYGWFKKQIGELQG